MCPLLEDPANGKVTTPPPYYVNFTAVYMCDDGYEPMGGSIRRVCMGDGTWSGTAPMCNCEYHPKKCTGLPKIYTGIPTMFFYR